MTRERLIELVDLVLSCEHWGTSHRVNLMVDNIGDHRMYVYPHVGKGKKSTEYYCNNSIGGMPEDFVYDKDFSAAEAHILRLLDEIKVGEGHDDEG